MGAFVVSMCRCADTGCMGHLLVHLYCVCILACFVHCCVCEYACCWLKIGLDSVV